ncbi:MAG: peptidylprolyl isomerase [Fibrobacterota bacterium]
MLFIVVFLFLNIGADAALKAVSIIDTVFPSYGKREAELHIMRLELLGNKPDISPENLEDLENSMVRQKMEEIIFGAEAASLGIYCKPEEVGERISIVMNGVYENDSAMFFKALKQEGITLSEYRKNLAVRIKSEKAREKYYEKINISDSEIKTYYKAKRDEFKEKVIGASHILFSSENGEDKAEKKAEKVLKYLKDGASFDSLASVFSDCPSGKNSGGALGVFGKGRMVKGFEEAAFSLTEKGELAGPVATDFGYHIIRLDKPAHIYSYSIDEVKDKIRGKLREKEEKKIMETLYKKYGVKFFKHRRRLQ